MNFLLESIIKRNTEIKRKIENKLKKDLKNLNKKKFKKNLNNNFLDLKLEIKYVFRLKKKTFLRGYQQKWTEEIFVISHRYLRNNIPVYK